MRIATVRLFASAFLGLASAPGLAHDLWLEPSDFSPEPGRAVALHLHLGHGRDIEAIGRPADRLLRFSVTDPGGREAPIRGVDGQKPAGILRPPEPGLQVVGYHTKPLVHRLSARRFRRVLTEEGLEQVRQSRLMSGTDDRDTTERYWRCLKALISVGEDSSGGRDRALGLPLELVAAFDPRRVDGGSPLPLTLLFRGRPLAGAQVVAHSLVEPHRRQEARSGPDGTLVLALEGPGPWRVHAVHMIPAEPATGVEWESFWTALSFELPAAATPPRGAPAPTSVTGTTD